MSRVPEAPNLSPEPKPETELKEEPIVGHLNNLKNGEASSPDPAIAE